MAQHEINGGVITISDEIEVTYPQLVTLVLRTDSMDSTEKQYWFDTLVTMTDEQIDRLFNILETERIKLEELENKYQEEIRNLNEKHLIEWQEFQSKDTRDKVSQAEAKDKKNDDTDGILSMLNNI